MASSKSALSSDALLQERATRSLYTEGFEHVVLACHEFAVHIDEMDEATAHTLQAGSKVASGALQVLADLRESLRQARRMSWFYETSLTLRHQRARRAYP